MGYYTTFSGSFLITPELEPRHREYLRRFHKIPHYRYDVTELAKIHDPVREAVDLPVGVEGEFSIVVGDPDEHWTDEGISLEPPKVGARTGLRLEGARTPATMPDDSPWCPWNVDDAVSELQIYNGDGDSVKAYGFADWLPYCIKNFFQRWGYKLDGEVYWEGEDRDDLGKIAVHDNHITMYVGKINYEPYESWSPEATNEEA